MRASRGGVEHFAALHASSGTNRAAAGDAAEYGGVSLLHKPINSAHLRSPQTRQREVDEGASEGRRGRLEGGPLGAPPFSSHRPSSGETLRSKRGPGFVPPCWCALIVSSRVRRLGVPPSTLRADHACDIHIHLTAQNPEDNIPKGVHEGYRKELTELYCGSRGVKRIDPEAMSRFPNLEVGSIVVLSCNVPR